MPDHVQCCLKFWGLSLRGRKHFAMDDGHDDLLDLLTYTCAYTGKKRCAAQAFLDNQKMQRVEILSNYKFFKTSTTFVFPKLFCVIIYNIFNCCFVSNEFRWLYMSNPCHGKDDNT